MLFLASKVLEHEVYEETRLLLLDKLQRENWTPLIRSTRLDCYKQALLSSNHVGEMEHAIALSTRLEDNTAYVRGDIFCFDDHVFFLVFGDRESASTGIRAGIIYEPQTAEPLRKLDAFCQKVSECLMESAIEAVASKAEGERSLSEWKPWHTGMERGFTRFVVRQDVDVLYTVVRKETARERVRAAEWLDNAYTRSFLRNAKVAYAEGYAGRLLSESESAPPDFSINKLVEVGLLRREVLVSCRETGHALLGLPSPDALAVITVSDATCSECGVRVANEKIEEVVAPTHLASALLDDAAWLVNRFHTILRNLGIPESEIAIEPPTGDGEAYMMSNVCGEPFLFVLRDGDLTPAFARRSIDMQIETEANHLVIVATGTIHNEGRTHLLNYANRLTRGGKEFELMIVDGTSTSATELKHAFERVSQKVLAAQLCELDTSLGFSVTRLITTRFELLHKSNDIKPLAQLPAAASTAAAAPSSTSLQNDEHTMPLIELTFPGMNDENEAGSSGLSPTHLSHEPGWLKELDADA
jgi:C4-type Zn-finger protein